MPDRAEFPLPAIINPPGRRCIQINVPDHPDHIRVFAGLLQQMTYWFNWDRDDLHKGTLVADVWKDVFYSIDWSNMSCCPEPTNQRYNADGHLEVSYDNGNSWEVANELDPRFNAPTYPELPGANDENKRCAAASSGVETFKQDIIDALASGQSYSTIFDLLIVVVAQLVGTGIPPLAAIVVGLIFTAGIAAVQAAFTAEVWETYLCILFCNMSDDASFTEQQWQTVRAEIQSQLTGIAALILENWVYTIGPVGLTNSCRARRSDDSAECVDCGCQEAWCHYFLFNAGQQGWSIRTDPNPYGQYTLGVGFQQNADYDPYDSVGIISPTFAATITLIKVIYDPELIGVSPRTIFMVDGLTEAHWVHTGGGGTEQTYFVPGGINVTDFIALDADPRAGGQQAWGGAIKAVQIEGRGVDPFGTPNCPE